MRNFVLISALVLGLCDPAQMTTSVDSGHNDRLQFDGTWWLLANPGERSGFMNGVADCMTWEAHHKGYSATPEQLSDKITKFYQRNPESRNLSVLEVWHRVLPTPAPTGGETWANPHWYLNGDWWAQQAQTERTGFVEGYLWCLKTEVEVPHANYSKPANFYREKINAYVEANPKLGGEAVAKTLARFKDASK